MPVRRPGPVLYCGDPHGSFRHINEAAGHTRASAVVLLGDLEPSRALHEELAPLANSGTELHFIHGNHDARRASVGQYAGRAERARTRRDDAGRHAARRPGRCLQGSGLGPGELKYTCISVTRGTCARHAAARPLERRSASQAPGNDLSGGC